MKVDDKIELAKSMCDGKKNSYKYNYIYPFTTENINGYLDLFDFNNKSYLTVGSSGDQVLNAMLNGCNDITVIDICPFAKEYFYLKMMAVQFMSRKDFLDFFCYKGYRGMFLNNNRAFMDSTYCKLLSYLKDYDNNVFYFWKQLFMEYKGITIRTKLFNPDEDSWKALVHANKYLENDLEYNKLRKMISKIYDIRFINEDIFSNKIDKEYDNINLSNLGTCYKIEEFFKLFSKMNNRLNDNGKMIVSYLFDTNIPYENGHKKVYDIKFINDRLLDGNGEFISFISNSGYEMNWNNAKDGVISYKKVKKI